MRRTANSRRAMALRFLQVRNYPGILDEIEVGNKVGACLEV